MRYSRRLETAQLLHMAALQLPRPLNPGQAAALHPLQAVVVPVARSLQLTILAAIPRYLPLGAQTQVSADRLVARSQPIDSGINARLYETFVRNFM